MTYIGDEDDMPRSQQRAPRPPAFEVDSNIRVTLHRDLALVISQCILDYDWGDVKPNTAAIAFAKKLYSDILHAGQ